MGLTLRPIPESGPVSPPAPQSLHIGDVVDQTRKLYGRVGFVPPWLGYLAFEDDLCVGTCGFASPPRNNRVEIAYFTFPEHEGRGIATRMASDLIRVADRASPRITVTAHTLPKDGASTAVLVKLGFTRTGALEDPEDGLIWEWELGKS
jgi:RimJ/RimL family protein N-acetyltransferase